MEDKKTLWIIIGIGVCVLVVAAVGFFWFLPTDQSLASVSGDSGPVKAGASGFDPVEWVRQDDSFPGIDEKTEKPEDFVVVSDEVVYGVPETADKTAGKPAAAVEAAGATITLNVPVENPVRETAAAAVKPAAPVVRTAEPKPVEKKTVTVTEYWIQAGSFTSLSKATAVKTELNEKGATSTISTTNVNGTDYYRVRIGPYSAQMEADKFLSWIKAVDGFENSYVSEVYVKR